MPGERILIVLDDPLGLKQSQFMLEAEGHEVVLAFGGQDGLAHLADNTFDLAICDIELGDATGIEIVDIANQRGTRVIVVASTARLEFPDGIVVHGLLERPYCAADLLDLSERVLALKRGSAPSLARRGGRVVNQALVKLGGRRRRRRTSTARSLGDAPAEVAAMLIRARREAAAAAASAAREEALREARERKAAKATAKIDAPVDAKRPQSGRAPRVAPIARGLAQGDDHAPAAPASAPAPSPSASGTTVRRRFRPAGMPGGPPTSAPLPSMPLVPPVPPMPAMPPTSSAMPPMTSSSVPAVPQHAEPASDTERPTLPSSHTFNAILAGEVADSDALDIVAQMAAERLEKQSRMATRRFVPGEVRSASSKDRRSKAPKPPA